MALILVVDDGVENRDFIATLMSYRGHTTLEAEDGARGLILVRERRPDLVICDIVMPTMDGYEFVRQLRADPAIADTRVIFYSAHFLEREAGNLALACGVSHILVKPCEPEEVLRIVDTTLALPTSAKGALPEPEFERRHLQLMADKLSEKADQLVVANSRLAALTELNLQIASERDPQLLLDKVCKGARELFGAKYAVLGARDKNGTEEALYAVSGFSAEAAARLHHPTIEIPPFDRVLSSRRALRLRNPSGDPLALDLPASYPPVHACVIVPVISIDNVYGWICLIDKLGADEFSETDATECAILGAQVGRSYENGSLYHSVKRYASKLESEIAGHRHAAQALREAEANYRSIFENAVEGIFRATAGGKLLAANPALARMLGYPSPEALVLSITDIGTQCYADPVRREQAMNLLVENGVVHGFEVEWLRKDGSRIWISLSGSREPEVHPGIRNHIAMVEDITERKRIEYEVLRLNVELEKRVEARTAQLAAAMKEQEAFSYSVSHDLRAPLRIIDYFSRVLDEDFGEKMNAETRSNLGRVRTAAKRMAMMIEDLLNLSRLSHGEIRVDNVDLSKMAREVMGELARQNPGRKVEVSIQDGLGARGDAGLLRIVLDNLLGNAWKYTGKKDVAHIAFSRVALGRNDAFLIEDNGNGFDMAHAENIFAPFQRFHSAAEFEGTGIGLATVQRIVNRHAGKIWVESDVAKGTRVYWTLGAASASG